MNIPDLSKLKTPWNMNLDAIEIITTDLANQDNPVLLEIGTHNGYAALHFSPYCSKILTIEKDPQFYDQAIRNTAGTNITVIKADALEYLKTLTQTFDIIIIDAQKSQYAQYLEECLPLLRPHGTIYADNTISHKNKLRAFFEQIQQLHLQSTELITEQGLVKITL